MKRNTKKRQALNQTARDLKIFQKLNAAGWLTSTQIRDYFFRGKTSNAVCKRLRKLVGEKYLAIVRTSSTETAIYRLAKRGKLVLMTQTRADAEEVNIPTQLPRKLGHFMAINDLRFHFERVTDAAGVELLYFFSERELSRYYQNLGGVPELKALSGRVLTLLKTYKIIPDAIARVRFKADGLTQNRDLFIEYDAGTENAAFFGNTKIKRYTELFMRNHDCLNEMRVLTFTNGIKRIVSLMRLVVEQHAPRSLLYFALLEKLAQHQWPTAAIFLEPYDFFVPVRQGGHVQVAPKDTLEKGIPKHALLGLPAASPCARRLWMQETAGNATVYLPTSAQRLGTENRPNDSGI